MGTRRALRWAGTAAVAGAVLLVAGCGGGKEVTFTPAANASDLVQPAGGGASTAGGAGGGAASSSGSGSGSVALPPDVEVSTQGSSICVRNRTTGSKACVGDHSTAVVNGVVIVDGKVVAASGSAGGGSGGASVVVGGDAVGADVASAATSGQVTLAGAVRWQGRATGTCQRFGDVRHAVVELAGGGRLSIDAVSTGVVRIELEHGGTSYSGNWVGSARFISLAGSGLTVTSAPLGRGGETVQVSATLDC